LQTQLIKMLRLTTFFALMLACAIVFAQSQGGGGGNSSQFLGGNANAIYASPVCTKPSSGNCFFVNADGQYVTDAVYSNVTTSCGGVTVPAGTCITSASATFKCPGSFPCSSGGDNGKIEFLTTGAVWAGNGVIDSQGTIVQVCSANAVQISAAHTTAGTGGNFAWGSDDTANLQAAAAQLNTTSSTAPNTLVLPAGGMMMIQQMPFKFTALHAYEVAIIGQGPNTVIMSTPNFDGTTCASGNLRGCIFDDTNGGLGSPINTNDYLANFTVFGMGQSLVNGTNLDNHSIINLPALSVAENINLVGWGWNYKNGATPFYGIVQTGFGTLANSIVNGGGNINYYGGIALSTNAAMPLVSGSFFGIAKNEPCKVVGYVEMIADTCYTGGTTTNNVAMYVNGTGNGALAHLYSDRTSYNGLIFGDTGGYAFIDGAAIQCNTTNGCLWNAGANFYLKHTLDITNSGAGVTLKQTSGTFTDEGGNISPFPAGTSITGGSVFGITNSATATACATGNFALTSGWGTSSVASVAANGNILGCHVTITGAAGSSGPVLTWTYPVAPILAPGSCHLSGPSGTLTGVSAGTPGTTTVAFTFTGTPSAQTYSFDVGCP
jgi:hypothetical protein